MSISPAEVVQKIEACNKIEQARAFAVSYNLQEMALIVNSVTGQRPTSYIKITHLCNICAELSAYEV